MPRLGEELMAALLSVQDEMCRKFGPGEAALRILAFFSPSKFMSGDTKTCLWEVGCQLERRMSVEQCCIRPSADKSHG
eukprot:4192929-Amphidinium_carterae.1